MIPTNLAVPNATIIEDLEMWKSLHLHVKDALRITKFEEDMIPSNIGRNQQSMT